MEKGFGGSPSCMVQQQVTEMETELFSFLFQAVTALGILALWIFQTVFFVTCLGNALIQPCTSQGENHN